MSRPIWFVGLIKKTFPTVKSTARLTRAPLIGRLLERKFFEGDRLVILPKEGVVRVGEELEPPERTVLTVQVLEHFIEKANPEYIWIMDGCICRESMDCRRYPHDIGCLFMGEAVKGINPRLGRRVTGEEALEHIRRAREAGLFNLIGRNKVDTWWLNTGPGERLLTVCSCCTCCCLWRMLPSVSDSISEKITRMPGVRVSVTDRCTVCGECVDGVCMAGAINLEGGRAVISDACRGCGNCVEVCPEGAIEIFIEDEGFVRETIESISAVVDIS